MKIRESNLEILRIVAMIMIVALHAVTQSNVLELQDVLSTNWLISVFARTGVLLLLVHGSW